MIEPQPHLNSRLKLIQYPHWRQIHRSLALLAGKPADWMEQMEEALDFAVRSSGEDQPAELAPDLSSMSSIYFGSTAKVCIRLTRLTEDETPPLWLKSKFQEVWNSLSVDENAVLIFSFSQDYQDKYSIKVAEDTRECLEDLFINFQKKSDSFTERTLLVI